MDMISYALAKKAYDIASGEGLKISDIKVLNGELIITLSTGEIINAGKIPSSDLEEVNRQIEEIKNSSLSNSGGVLTGPLTLAADPSEDLQAATKQYVDKKIIEYVVNRPTKNDFPKRGLSTVLYKAEEEAKLYQWNSISSTYEPLGGAQSGGIENIEIINGGNSNARN